MTKAKGRLSRRPRTSSVLRKEYLILELLMRRLNQVVTRDQIINAGWGYDADVRDNTVDYLMHNLRQKIDQKDKPSMIRTVRSFGYSMVTSE